MSTEKIKKYSLKYFFVKRQIKKDENFLIREGIRKAKEQRLEIKLGDEILSLENKKGIIDLPSYGGSFDTRKLIALVADDYARIVKKYLCNKKRLDM